jgi:hypothetical protein
MGSLAAAMLLQRLIHRDRQPERVELKPSLVVRQSSRRRETEHCTGVTGGGVFRESGTSSRPFIA